MSAPKTGEKLLFPRLGSRLNLVGFVGFVLVLGLVFWLVMKGNQETTPVVQNGTKEIIRGIERNIEKLAEAQVEANTIQERKVRAVERIADSFINNQFKSRNNNFD